jgi:IS5 family transposase
MLEAVKATLQALPEQVLADTGYKSEAVFAALAECGCEVVVALGREGKAQLALDPERMPHTAAMAAKLQSAAARRDYARRKWLAEPPNGWIKHVLGFRQFSVRGLSKVKAEWKLVCMALNLRRMATMQGG